MESLKQVQYASPSETLPAGIALASIGAEAVQLSEIDESSVASESETAVSDGDESSGVTESETALSVEEESRIKDMPSATSEKDKFDGKVPVDAKEESIDASDTPVDETYDEELLFSDEEDLEMDEEEIEVSEEEIENCEEEGSESAEEVEEEDPESEEEEIVESDDEETVESEEETVNFDSGMSDAEDTVADTVSVDSTLLQASIEKYGSVILELVTQVLPDEIENVPAMIEQFLGREEELIESLQVGFLLKLVSNEPLDFLIDCNITSFLIKEYGWRRISRRFL